ncbi:MAG: protein kinase [Steroidobacteraceae bacterium]
MNKVARLIDDLRAARRGEIAFESVPGRISSRLASEPESAEELLRQLESAFEQQIIEPAQLMDLRTVILDTVSSRQGIRAASHRTPPPTPDQEESGPADGTVVFDRGRNLSQRSSGQKSGTGGPVSRSNIKIGTRLRDRFILDEVLGVGGMGTVYKGRDLLKVEARDRNPYVAIKVLNDDFKKRDDAFIVLQREASRQQRLAHPNIVTVYDFDRTGDIIFISMELLEGTPLDVFLKSHSRPRGGMSYDEALPLIEGMCAALTYAHAHGIVHADFKPSNCFVLEGGKIKVLDFGIARAMKKPNQLETDLTVYDGSSLGAMTPAYASPEMLEQSADPDARDDIYALACVCYEVLSGWHPFNRVSALDARDQELAPKHLRGLNAKQNRALCRALAFDRSARTPNVREFIAQLGEGGEAPSRWNRRTAGIAAAIAAVSLIGGVWYVRHHAVSQTLADLKSGDSETTQAAIERLDNLSPSDRAEVLENGRASIVAYFRNQVQGMLDTGEIDAANAKADAMLNAGLAMYPDAAALVTLRSEVASRRERYLSELAEQYETYLAAGRLLRSKEHGDIQGVMQRIQLVDPRHPLLTDPRVAGAFAAAAETAIDTGKLELAQALIADGTRLAPRDGLLRDVADKLETAGQLAQRQRRSSELAAQIEGQLGTLTALDALTPTLADALIELHGIDPANVALDSVRNSIQSLLGKDHRAIAGADSIDAAKALERRYVPAFEALTLTDAVARLHARREELTARHEELVVQARALATAPGTKTAAGTSIGQVIGELRKLSPGDPEVDAIVTTAASEQRRVAQRLSADHEWNAARAALNSVLALSSTPEMKALVTQDMERIAERERDSARESAEAERVVARTVERMKVETVTANLQAALNSFAPTAYGLATLGAQVSALAALDPGNPMIQSARTTAAQRIAAAAGAAAEAGRFTDAHELLAKAAVDLPGVAAITAARSRVEALQVESGKRAQDQLAAAAQQKFRAVLERAAPTETAWQREADAALAALRKVATNDEVSTTSLQQLASAYVDAAGKLADAKRFTIAAQLLDKAEQLTPKSPIVLARREQLTQAAERLKTERAAEELAAKLDATRQRFDHEIKSRQFDRARKTLGELQAIGSKDDAFVTRQAPTMLVDGYAGSARAALKAGNLDNARQLARAGMAFQKDDARFAQLLTEIDAAAAVRPEPKAAPAPSTSVAVASAPAPAAIAPAVTTSLPATPPAVAPIPTPVAAAPAPEPSLLGSWCSDGLGLDFAASTYAFDIGGGRVIKYPVERYQRNDDTITMNWTDKTLGAMVTEFGEFSADGQSMVQMRGKTAAGSEWKSYNRRFRRCK